MLYAYSLNGIERLTPSAIEYNVESENGQVNVTNILENGQVSLVDINLLRLNTNPEVTITESGQTIPYFDIISKGRTYVLKYDEKNTMERENEYFNKFKRNNRDCGLDANKFKNREDY